MKREKCTEARTDSCGISLQTRKERLCDFEKPRKRTCWKGKVESNAQSKEGGELK